MHTSPANHFEQQSELPVAALPAPWRMCAPSATHTTAPAPQCLCIPGWAYAQQPPTLMAAGSQPQVPRYTCRQGAGALAWVAQAGGNKRSTIGALGMHACLAAGHAGSRAPGCMQLLTLPKWPSPSRIGFPEGSAQENR